MIARHAQIDWTDAAVRTACLLVLVFLCVCTWVGFWTIVLWVAGRV